MAASAWIFAVDQGDFDNAVLQRSHVVPVVVDFWAPWCGPCRLLAPVLENLIDERQGEVLLAKVNIDDNQELAAQYGIMSIPTVIAFRGGQPVLDFMGLLPDYQIREFLDRLSPSEADRLTSQAKAVEETDPARAEQLYRQAVARDARHEAAPLGLARVLIAQGQDPQAREILENLAAGEEVDRLKARMALRELAQLADETTARQRLEADPNNALARYEIGCVLAAAAQYPEALDMLLSAGERDAKLAAAKVREAMVHIFQIIGVTSPLANEYREKLSAMLY